MPADLDPGDLQARLLEAMPWTCSRSSAWRPVPAPPNAGPAAVRAHDPLGPGCRELTQRRIANLDAATSSALNLLLVLGEFKRPRLAGPEPPDLRLPPLMSLRNVGKMNKEQARRSNRIVTHASACDDREPCLLHGIEDLGSEDHVVIARDEPFESALGEIGDQLVVLVGAERAGSRSTSNTISMPKTYLLIASRRIGCGKFSSSAKVARLRDCTEVAFELYLQADGLLDVLLGQPRIELDDRRHLETSRSKS